MFVLFSCCCCFGFFFCFHALYLCWFRQFLFSPTEIEHLLKEQDRRIKRCRKNEDNINALLSWILQPERWDYGHVLNLRVKLCSRTGWKEGAPSLQFLFQGHSSFNRACSQPMLILRKCSFSCEEALQDKGWMEEAPPLQSVLQLPPSTFPSTELACRLWCPVF